MPCTQVLLNHSNTFTRPRVVSRKMLPSSVHIREPGMFLEMMSIKASGAVDVFETGVDLLKLLCFALAYFDKQHNLHLAIDNVYGARISAPVSPLIVVLLHFFLN
ncbi:hypothetical protein EVAR_100693_1 [Eumeta japonica]|uniref:Uncharacterized protein n=1 Tax=Eumeta variegata TaxID=151549 RepID=A0A4C1SZY0_EUMVA|nr:hypothetical protein EVAR_100693_1 [Eumeta japonica]